MSISSIGGLIASYNPAQAFKHSVIKTDAGAQAAGADIANSNSGVDTSALRRAVNALHDMQEAADQTAPGFLPSRDARASVNKFVKYFNAFVQSLDGKGAEHVGQKRIAQAARGIIQEMRESSDISKTSENSVVVTDAALPSVDDAVVEGKLAMVEGSAQPTGMMRRKAVDLVV